MKSFSESTVEHMDEESLFLYGSETVLPLEPCIIVIFGVTGDLAHRKLFPALYHLGERGDLPLRFACCGFARREKSDKDLRSEFRESVLSGKRENVSEAFLEQMESCFYYFQGSFDDFDAYKRLKFFLDDLDKIYGTKGNRIFYLSTQPSYFPLVVKNLHKAGMISPKDAPQFTRFIVEKPFGSDLESAIKLQTELVENLSETQLYRIDHYLGKETVQNLLFFRFGNPQFESLWNKEHVDHIQITVAEDLGVGTRGLFWEETGLLRDIIQNHVMQLLALVLMEPPTQFAADEIRDEKVKVLQAVRGFSSEEIDRFTVRAQYETGFIKGQPFPSYRSEVNVNVQSTVETYAALLLWVDNWRWSGVPIFIRAGKALSRKKTEIAVFFKSPPRLVSHVLKGYSKNALIIEVQPHEGISFLMNYKMPGVSGILQPVKMDFSYQDFFKQSAPEAYEKLIKDCMVGDATLFARYDEVIASWQIVAPILERWALQGSNNLCFYEAGSQGPKEAEDLIKSFSRRWRFI